MKALIQRVSHASVSVEGQTIGEIEQGILVLVGIEKTDDINVLERMVNKLLDYRIFSDDGGKMNRSVKDVDGGVLAVSQFTLAANTRKGLRPSFSSAAAPQAAESLYDQFADILSKSYSKTAFGEFGADMKVSLLNDGPVTFLLEM